MQYEIRSPLDPETCSQRIENQLCKNVLSNQDRGPLWGSVQERNISVRLATGMRNPFAPYFRGRVEPAESGSLLCGECQTSSGLKTAALVWGLLWIVLPCAMTVVVEAIWIAFLFAFGEHLMQLGDETYRTLLSIPILALPFPIINAFIGIGFPVLFLTSRRGDCERIARLLEVATEGKRQVNDFVTSN